MEKLQTKRGFTLVEVLFYVALFAVLSVSVVDAMITMTRSFRAKAVTTELTQGGVLMERISREVRKALDITSISATDITLSTTDDLGASKTVEFLLSGSDVRLLENGTLTGNLNSPNLFVTALTFTQITTAQGKAVKVDLTVRSNNDSTGRTIDFNNTIGLRGIY